MLNRIRVVLDTNLWISYLIGFQLSNLCEVFDNPRLELIMTRKSFDELISVARRPKFNRYFNEEKVFNLKLWLEDISTFFEIGEVPQRCRDPKDDYLLELAVQAKAIYLVSGDDDLLSIGEIDGCRIMTFAQFIEELQSRHL